jgi:hypothetical protein
MKGELVVVGVSLLLFLATEFFFPIQKDDPIARRQKHFWSIILTLFSLILGESITSSFELSAKIENIGSVFQELAEEDIRSQFQMLFTEYHRHFEHSRPLLKEWARQSFKKLTLDMKQGYVPLPNELAAEQIGKAYPTAKESIVATNVGSTKFYFNNVGYIENNTAAAKKGIPVIRFYLFSRNRQIELRKSDKPQIVSFEEFCTEIGSLHEQLSTVYSTVVDVDEQNIREHRDLLLLDNEFVAETELMPTSWVAIRAKATEDQNLVSDVRDYLHILQGARSRCTFRMKDDLVRGFFPKYRGITLKQGDGQLADRVFEEIMDSISK